MKIIKIETDSELSSEEKGSFVLYQKRYYPMKVPLIKLFFIWKMMQMNKKLFEILRI